MKRDQYRQPDPRSFMSEHDHVGSMVFGADTAVCTVCGQRWVLLGRGWSPLHPDEPDPDNLVSPGVTRGHYGGGRQPT